MPQKEQGLRAGYISQQVNPRQGQWGLFLLASSQGPGLWPFQNGSPLLNQYLALLALSPMGDNNTTPENRAIPRLSHSVLQLDDNQQLTWENQGCEGRT